MQECKKLPAGALDEVNLEEEKITVFYPHSVVLQKKKICNKIVVIHFSESIFININFANFFKTFSTGTTDITKVTALANK